MEVILSIYQEVNEVARVLKAQQANAFENWKNQQQADLAEFAKKVDHRFDMRMSRGGIDDRISLDRLHRAIKERSDRGVTYSMQSQYLEIDQALFRSIKRNGARLGRKLADRLIEYYGPCILKEGGL